MERRNLSRETARPAAFSLANTGSTGPRRGRHNMDRRQFLAGGLAFASGSAAAAPSLASRVCLFTDHLAGFSYEEVARMLKQLGVAGPDLTVRRGGLVDPDKVTEELPKAMAAF